MNAMDDLHDFAIFLYRNQYPCTLCSYPTQEVCHVHVSSSALSRAKQTAINAALKVYLSKECVGTECVLSAVEWVRAHIFDFVEDTDMLNDESKQVRGRFSRRLRGHYKCLS